MADKQQWNERYREAASAGLPEPALVLSENAHLLPDKGMALDLACGRGANAIFLVQHGLQVSAWDYSPVAVEQLQQYAKQQALTLRVEVRDVVHNPPGKESFDVIVVSRFLERAIIPQLCAALKPQGLIFYQTFIAEKDAAIGPGNPDYLLQPNELLALFAALRIRVYREEGLLGDMTCGFRNEAMLVAQRLPELRHRSW
ncbi:class I SAM-dependent methyltransferase [Kaarinaea lacus]